MKKILLSLALVVPSVGFGQQFGADWKTIMPQEFQKITPQQGAKFLDIVTAADDIQIPEKAIEKLNEFFELRTPSLKINKLLGSFKPQINVIISTKNPKNLVGALEPLHKDLSLLALDIKAANADAKVKKAFESLEKVVAKTILLKAKQWLNVAKGLSGQQKTNALKAAYALIYVLTNAKDSEMLDVKTKALDVQNQILDIIPKKDLESTLKTIQEQVKKFRKPGYEPGIR